MTDLRTMQHFGGLIERGIINAAVAQMAQHFRLPLYSTGGCWDSKVVDIQASYGGAMMNLLVAMGGANYIHGSAGLMESGLAVSYEKLVMDTEILGICQRVLRGIDVSDKTLGTALMIEKGPGGDFVAVEHTVRHMRQEFFVPQLAKRKRRESDSPGQDALSRAKALINEIRRQTPVSRLPAKLRQQLLATFSELSPDHGYEARRYVSPWDPMRPG